MAEKIMVVDDQKEIRDLLRIRHLNDELERAMAYIEELDRNLPKR